MIKPNFFPGAGTSTPLQNHASALVNPARLGGLAQPIAGIDPMLRKPMVLDVTGLSNSVLRRLEKSNDFPARVKLSPHGRAVGWRASQVAQWLESRTSTGDVQ